MSRATSVSKMRGNKRSAPYQKKPKPDPKELPTVQLDRLLPRAGMIYPFPKGIMRYQIGDTRVAWAICGAQGEGANPRNMKKNVVERQVADLFVGAQKFLASPLTAQFLSRPPTLDAAIAKLGSGAAAQTDHKPLGAITFLYILRGWLLGGYSNTTAPAEEDGNFAWLHNEISFKMFAALFLILRTARLRWHKTPRLPLKIEEHSVLPRTIDEFNKAAAKRIDWGGIEMVVWLRDGAMWLDPRSNGERVDDELAEKMGAVALEDDALSPGESKKLDMGRLQELMELLSIECTWKLPN